MNSVGQQRSEEKSVVLGVLVSASTNEALPYAAIGVYGSVDSNLVVSDVTDLDGQFSVELTPGKYFLQIQYIGFENLTLSNILVLDNQPELDLGNIKMQPSAIALEEVEVRGERSQMEFKLDRRVFNVGKDLANSGKSAADILDRVPSVSVDPEGNVSLRGSMGVRILIDGKPSGLLSAEDTKALVRMQGDIIEAVEVITNPSAKYEAEGEAGIINIILKKNQEKGFNGSFSTTLGWPDIYGAAYNLNYRRKNFNFFSNFGLDYRRAPGGGNATQEFYKNGVLTNSYTSQLDQNRGGLGGFMQLGTDWTIDEKNTLTGYLLYRLTDGDHSATMIYTDYDDMGIFVDETIRDIAEDEESHNLETSLSYRHTFDQPDREWTIDFKYILDDDTELARYDQNSINPPTQSYQRSSNTEDESVLFLKTDYVHPIDKETKIESGLNINLRKVDNDFLVEELEGDDYIPLPEFDDQLIYNEDILAAYVLASHSTGPFGFQAGLRGEQSLINASLVKSDTSSEQNYFSLFPSTFISYKITDKDQFQLSYSRRLSRPYFRYLLPFSNYMNPRNNWIGNPNLQPEFTNAFELGYLRYLNKGTLLSTIFYRRTTGVIERLTLPTEEEGIVIRYPVNLSKRDAFGLEFNFSYDLREWWNIMTDLNVFRAITDGEFEETNYSSDTYSWGGRVQTQFDMGTNVKIQASFDYQAPVINTQGKQLSSYNFDFGISWDIFKGNGTLVLSAYDIFDTRKRRIIVDQPDYKSKDEFQWRKRRQVVLTFNYRLNQEKKKGQILDPGS